MYDQIRAIHKKYSPESDQMLDQEFNSHVGLVMENLGKSVKNPTATYATKTSNGLKAKYDMYDICLDKLVHILTFEQSGVANILREINQGV
jgi:hypothetical protein